MVHPILICFLLLIKIAFLIILANFYKLLRVHLKIASGYLLDAKVDNIIRKSAILGEMYSFDQQRTPQDRINYAYEKSMAIASDVLLQNGINPREYNLPGLTMIARLTLGMKVTEKGGEKNGKG